MERSGTLLGTTHPLEGGLRVRLRLARPSDARRVDEFLARLRPVPEVGAEHFTYYDPRFRLVVAATCPGERGEEVVGLADVSFDETWVLVADEERSRGVARLLDEAAASLTARASWAA